jgi:hypothetical protein
MTIAATSMHLPPRNITPHHMPLHRITPITDIHRPAM